MDFDKLYNISLLLPFKFLSSLNKQAVIPLLYHSVGDVNKTPYLKNLYQIPTPERFEKDVDFLLKHYQPIGLPELIKYVNEGVLPSDKKFFFLSFDDGLKECSDPIAPILLRKGVPATFFLNSGFIENEILFHRFITNLLVQKLKQEYSSELKQDIEQCLDIRFENMGALISFLMNIRYDKKETIFKLKEFLDSNYRKELFGYKAYMTKVEVEGLIANGFTIGAHSIDHPEFYLLSKEDQLKQASESIEQITNWFKLDYKVFAFPFTDVGVSQSFFQSLDSICQPDLTFGCSGLKKDTINTNIQRIAMDDSQLSAKNRLKAELLYYGLKKPFGKNTYRRK